MKKILVILLLFSFYSCKKKAKPVSEHPVKSVTVNLTIYPNDPLYFKVQSIGGWMYIDGGINGIILYRKSNEEFVALERTSSYAPDDVKSRAIVMKDNFTLQDTVSDSRWRMMDGSVTQGPAEWGLRVYGTSYNGNSLAIRN